MRLHVIAFLFLITALASCSSGGGGDKVVYGTSTGTSTGTSAGTDTSTSTILTFPSWAGGADSTFTDATTSAGLSGMNRTRVAWGDYNGDGYPDLLLDGRVLFKNNCNGTFTNVSAAAGVGGPYNGGVWADYNNDGFLDFYATNGAYMGNPDALFKNNGDETFTNVTATVGNPSDTMPTHGVAWGDFDRNGWVDIYLANYETEDASAIGTPDSFFKNTGGTFTNAKASSNLAVSVSRNGRGVNCGDYDGDGDLDIYVSNYRLDCNFLFRNNGAGAFNEVAEQLGVQGYYVRDYLGNEAFGHTIGSDWGDFNCDGHLDLITGNLAHPDSLAYSDTTCIYFNHRHGAGFTDIFNSSGVAYEETHSSPSWGDYNNDGGLDFYITCVYDGRYAFLYKNNGVYPNTFTDVSAAKGVRANNGWGCAWADIDRDGDIDLVVGSGSGLKFYLNNGNANSWLGVELICTVSNRAGIGARVKCAAGTFTQMREVDGGHGTGCQNAQALNFGLGTWAGTVSVEVRWPNGAVKTVNDVTLNQYLTVTED
ncbi:MAG: CRTAC1 family protein [Planctomycetota bacterium]|jgi:hypothetical protein